MFCFPLPFQCWLPSPNKPLYSNLTSLDYLSAHFSCAHSLSSGPTLFLPWSQLLMVLVKVEVPSFALICGHWLHQMKALVPDSCLSLAWSSRHTWRWWIGVSEGVKGSHRRNGTYFLKEIFLFWWFPTLFLQEMQNCKACNFLLL